MFQTLLLCNVQPEMQAAWLILGGLQTAEPGSSGETRVQHPPSLSPHLGCSHLWCMSWFSLMLLPSTWLSTDVLPVKSRFDLLLISSGLLKLEKLDGLHCLRGKLTEHPWGLTGSLFPWHNSAQLVLNKKTNNRCLMVTGTGLRLARHTLCVPLLLQKLRHSMELWLWPCSQDTGSLHLRGAARPQRAWCLRAVRWLWKPKPWACGRWHKANREVVWRQRFPFSLAPAPFPPAVTKCRRVRNRPGPAKPS